jgi:hypothetical protein
MAAIAENLKEGCRALSLSCNIVAFAIVAWAAALTTDWLLLAIFAAVELAFLLSASTSTTIRGWIETRRGASKDFLDYVLLWVTASGFVVISFFGFGKHLLTHPWPSLTHAAGWEAGAIVWTGLFLFYYIAKFKFTNIAGVDKAVVILLAVGNWKLLSLAWSSMGRPIEHVLCVLLVGCSFLIIDGFMTVKHAVPKERSLSRASLVWADAPMVGSLLILWVFLLVHRDTEHPDIFVSGVVSCQLLISNAIFVVMEFGVLRTRLSGVEQERAEAASPKAGPKYKHSGAELGEQPAGPRSDPSLQPG